jgi:hypothetical protein
VSVRERIGVAAASNWIVSGHCIPAMIATLLMTVASTASVRLRFT